MRQNIGKKQNIKEGSKKKVIIMGGGVGGLAVAHELSKYPDKYEIHLFERNSELGGQARSKINCENKHTELCWHAFGTGYVYFLRILDEIINPADNIRVISHLKPLDNFIYARDDKIIIERGKSFLTEPSKYLSGFRELYDHEVPLMDKLRLMLLFFKSHAACQERIESYDSILWRDEIENMSEDVKRWVLDSTSIYLGMDYNKISKHFMLNMLRHSQTSPLLDDTAHNFYCMDAQMNEVLFDVWGKYLNSRGVTIHLNTEIISVNAGSRCDSTGVNIDSIDIKCLCSRIYTCVQGDIFINGLDIKSLSYLYPSVDSPVDFLDKSLSLQRDRYGLLNDNSCQVQTQVLYYLPYRLQPIGTTPTVIILPDSPWFLMVRIEGDFWETKNCDYLSAGIGMWDVDGNLFGLSAGNSTREQIAKECWDQICRSKHNLQLSNVMPEWDMWNSFQFDEKRGQLLTDEPKFSNNIYTLNLRPNFNDEYITNLYHATAYTRTQENIYNMESAAEAGVCVANLIESGSNLDNTVDNPNIFWRILRWFDGIIF